MDGTAISPGNKASGFAAAPARGKCAAVCNANVGGSTADVLRALTLVGFISALPRYRIVTAMVYGSNAGIGYKLPCIVVEDFFIDDQKQFWKREDVGVRAMTAIDGNDVPSSILQLSIGNVRVLSSMR